MGGSNRGINRGIGFLNSIRFAMCLLEFMTKPCENGIFDSKIVFVILPQLDRELQTMQFISSFLIASIALLLSPHFSTAQESKKSSEALLLKNATIHSMSGAESYKGSILIEDGKIKTVAKSIESPDGVKVIDLDGFHAVPGLIESRGKLWIDSGSIRESSARAELNMVDAIDPWLEDWKELAAQGITSVYVQPGSNATLGGYGAVLRVGPHGSVDSIVMKEKAAVQASVGLTGRSSKDRYAQVSALEKLLEAAKKELEKVKKEEEAQKKKDKSKKSDSKRGTDKKKDDKKEKESDKDKDKDKDDEEKDEDKDDEKDEEESDEDDDDKKKDAKDNKKDDKKSSSKYKPTTDTSKIALMKVLKKEIPLNLELHHSDVLRRVLKIAKKYEIRLVLDGLSNIDSCCKELEEAGYPAVVGPLYETGTPPAYRRDADFGWLAKGTKETPLWSLSSFSNSARSSRMLRTQAAHAIQHGVAHADVLAAITSNPARMLGVADHVGTIEEGKQADIAVFGGDPLNPSTPVRLVISHGKVIFDHEVSAQPFTIAKSDKKEDAKDENAKSNTLPSELPEHYAIKTTRLLKNGKFIDGTLVVKDGKVVASGKKAKPGDAMVFDVGDSVVTPGLVAASSTLGQSSNIVDATESDATHLRAVDAVDPTTKQAKKILNGGFVHIGVSPGSTNTSAGVVGHLRLGATEYVANPTIASRFNLTGGARTTARFPSSLNGQISMMNNVLDGQPVKSSVYVTAAISRSIKQEKVKNIHNLRSGKTKAIISANTKLELRSAMQLAKKNKIATAIRTGGEVGDFADQLAESGIGIIIPAANGTEYDTYFDHFVKAGKAGCPIAFEGDSPTAIRATAAMLVAAGLDSQKVFNGLTQSGAELVGMEKTALTRGAHADFVVWSDSPLNLSAKPLNVVVDGQIVSQK